MRKSFALTLALVCAVTLLVGCGKKVVKTEGVTGTITLDGAPLADCNVYFLAAEKGSGALDSFAKTDASGNYKLQTMTGAANAGTTPGKYKVRFDARVGVDTGKTEMVSGKEVPIMDVKSVLPKKYNDVKTSGFEVEVKPGANTIDFDLKSK